MITSQKKPWIEAVMDALWRIYEGNNNRRITYQQIQIKELDKIKRETQTKGKTPDRTLSKILQIIRDRGYLIFEDNQGTYILTDKFFEDYQG